MTGCFATGRGGLALHLTGRFKGSATSWQRSVADERAVVRYHEQIAVTDDLEHSKDERSGYRSHSSSSPHLVFLKLSVRLHLSLLVRCTRDCHSNSSPYLMALRLRTTGRYPPALASGQTRGLRPEGSGSHAFAIRPGIPWDAAPIETQGATYKELR